MKDLKKGSEIYYREIGTDNWLMAILIEFKDYAVDVISPKTSVNGSVNLSVFYHLYELSIEKP